MNMIRTTIATVLVAAAVGVPSWALAEPPSIPYTLVSEVAVPGITTVQERDEVMRLMSAHLGLWAASDPEQYAYADLLTEDAVFEYPLAGNDPSVHVAGRKAVIDVMRRLPGVATGWKFHDVMLFDISY